MMTFLNSELASSKSIDEVTQLLKTNLAYGLNEGEVLPRRKLYGYNEFEIKNSDPLWKKYLEKVHKKTNQLEKFSFQKIQKLKQ